MQNITFAKDLYQMPKKHKSKFKTNKHNMENVGILK